MIMDSTLQLKNLIQRCEFEKLQDEVANATKIALITVDYKGIPVTTHSCCSDFCNAVRSNPELKKLCEKCDSRGGLEAARLQQPYMYICHMGIVDFAIPIIYQNFYVGAIMCGQLKIDDDTCLERIISEKSSVSSIRNGEELIKKLPLMNMETAKAHMQMISYICNYRIGNELSIIRGDNTKVDAKPSKSAQLIEPALQYINENYSKTISLNTVAALCEVSPSYFSKIFKKVTGENLINYVNSLKTAKAKALLAQTNKSVSAIAFEVGFEDCGYFIKVFKKECGLTPNSYRASVSG